jgi:ligand-binding sensor domain-containing protein
MWTLVPILCSAQQNNQDVVFSRITTDQGLSSNRVNATVQDAEGYLWVATGNGLNRYDGYEVKEYLHDPEDSLTIAANEVLSVFLDRDDDLWVVGRNSGISRYERKQDRFQRFISDLPINSLVEDGRGQLWVLGEGVAGILNKATGAFTNYAKNYNASLFMHAASGQLPNELWMATAFDGLLLVDVDTKAALKHIRHEPGVPGLSSSRLFTVHAGKHHLWIGTYDSGLDALNFRTQTYANYRHRPNVANALQVNAVTSVLEWGDSLWIGTQNGGLSRLALSTQELVSFLPDKQNPNSISSSSIAHATGLYHDRANRLVIATHFGGVNVIDPQNQIFQNLEADGYTVNAVLKDTRGRLWMATENGIVQVHQRTQKKYLQLPGTVFKAGCPRTCLGGQLSTWIAAF